MPTKPLGDGDTGWHIMAGYEILKTGHIPHTNIFSFSSGNYAWLDISWLWDVIIAKIHMLGGLYLVSAAAIFVNALMLAALTWFCLRRGAGAVATIVTITVGLFMFVQAVLARPHECTMAFSLIFLMVAYFFDKEPNRKCLLVILPVIMVLWANMHGGFFTGFTIIGAYFLQFLWQRRWRDAFMLAFSGFLCVIAIFLNPLGYHLFEGASRTLSGPLRNYISEWHSPHQPTDYIFVVIYALALLTGFKKHSPAEIILSLFWLLEGVMAVRNMPIFIILATPMVADAVHQIGMKRQEFRDKEAEYCKNFSRPVVRIQSFFWAFLAAVFFALPVWPKLIGFKPEKLVTYPKAEIDYAVSHYPERNFMNSYDLGGYVIYESQGKMKTFIDGRAETAFPSDVVDDYIKFRSNQPGWQVIFGQFNITGAIIEKTSDELGYFKNNKDWRQEFEGENAVVFVKVK